MKNENEQFQEIIKSLKEEYKHIKDRSRNNDKIIEQEKTIKNLNSYLERQENDFNEEKMLNMKDEQIESLQEQLYLLTNQGGNNTIPSDPNESLDN